MPHWKNHEKETIKIMEGLGLKKGEHFFVEGANAYGDRRNNGFGFPYSANPDLTELFKKLVNGGLIVYDIGVGSYVHGYSHKLVYPEIHEPRPEAIARSRNILRK